MEKTNNGVLKQNIAEFWQEVIDSDYMYTDKEELNDLFFLFLNKLKNGDFDE